MLNPKTQGDKRTETHAKSCGHPCKMSCSCWCHGINLNTNGTLRDDFKQSCGHPLSAIVHNGTTNYCGQCADESLRENINKGIEA